MFDIPILFIIFNRPEETKLVFESIREAKPKALFIAADGPRESKKGEIEQCDKTREIVENVDWPCQVYKLYRDKNLGCGKAVSNAITWFFNNVEKGIILEDDCLPNKSFFIFCEEMLKKYEYDTRIMHINGSSFHFRSQPNKSSYFFSRYVNVWGWASWKRAWEFYCFNLEDYERGNKNIDYNQLQFSKKEVEYWNQVFIDIKTNKIDTWDYQWVFACWINDGISIMPNVNLISNIGFGHNATHTFDKNSRVANLPTKGIDVIKHPKLITIRRKVDKKLFEECYLNKQNFRVRVLNAVKRRFSRILYYYERTN